MGIMQMIGCWLMYFFMAPGIFKLIGKKNLDEDEQHTHKVAASLYYYTLVVGQIAAALATTTHFESLASYKLPNMKLNICIVLEIVFAAIIIYVPSVEDVFLTTGLTGTQMLVPWVVFVAITLVEEIRKSILRKT